MQLYFQVRIFTFKKLFHLINTSARPVQFVTGDLIGWAGRIAKSTMHAFAQNLFDNSSARILFEGLAQIGLHALQVSI